MESLQNKNILSSDEFFSRYKELSKLAPSIIDITAPEVSSKRAFMGHILQDKSGEIKQNYPKIDAIDPEIKASSAQLANELLQATDNMLPADKLVYQEVIETKTRQIDLALAMQKYNQAPDAATKQAAAREFMEANIDLYGEPDRQVYQSLLREKIVELTKKAYSPEGEQIFAELKALLPAEIFDQESGAERFRPSSETITWMHEVVHTLFDDVLKHVPETDNLLGPEEVKNVFQAVIDNEFGEAAADWTVEWKPTGAISVNSGARRVSIPEDRRPMSAVELKKLVVHELGTHVLTSLTGESTNLAPLRTGLAKYDSTQEGIAKVFEQALVGEFEEVGTEYYITAGLAYFENKSLRDVYEIKWRANLLKMLGDNEVPSQDQIDNAKRLALDGPKLSTMRIFRGTDELPLFKDLAYYNGAMEVWRYLESIRGDDFQLGLLLAGKINTSKQHQRVILESHSV